MTFITINRSLVSLALLKQNEHKSSITVVASKDIGDYKQFVEGWCKAHGWNFYDRSAFTASIPCGSNVITIAVEDIPVNFGGMRCLNVSMPLRGLSERDILRFVYSLRSKVIVLPERQEQHVQFENKLSLMLSR